MQRSLIVLGLAVFAVGVPVLAEGGIGTIDSADDGRHRVAVMLDPSTGEFIFADDIAREGTADPRLEPGSCGNGIRFLVAVDWWRIWDLAGLEHGE